VPPLILDPNRPFTAQSKLEDAAPGGSAWWERVATQNPLPSAVGIQQGTGIKNVEK